LHPPQASLAGRALPAPSVQVTDRRMATADPGVVQASATLPLEAVSSIQFEDEFTPSVSGSAAAVNREMTLEQALQYALDNHPLLQSREQEIEAARARLIAAGMFVNPRLVLDTDSPVNHNDRVEIAGRVEFTIPTAGKRWRRQLAAQAGVRRSQLTLARETERILLQAATAAIEVSYLQDLLELNRRLEQVAEDRTASATSPLGDGTTQLEVLTRFQADIDLVSARSQRLDTQSNLAVARNALNRAIGLEAQAQVTMRVALEDADYPLLPLESVLALARQNNPRLAEACATLTESLRNHDLAQAEPIPDPQLGPTYRDELGRDRDRIGARIEVDLPAFDRNEGGILETAANVQSNRALVRVAELESLNDVVAAYRELEAIRSSIDAYEQDGTNLVQRYQAILEEPAVKRLVTPDQLLGVRQDLLALELRQLRLRYRYFHLLAQLEILLGDSIALMPQAVEQT
jgi:cobalt-zinc-cadmium efflux system outer membrane protein